MIHKPISLDSLNLILPHKVCFENFSTQIMYGSRIAIIGRNGSGKSTLLKMIKHAVETQQNHQQFHDVICGYVPQIIEDYNDLSGGQRFNKVLTQALSINPNVLLLDEPTNHLDITNRKGLMHILRTYPNTLMIVTHDLEILNHHVNTLWHLDQERIHQFSGQYRDYQQDIQSKRLSLEHDILQLNRQKKDLHQSLMKEQNRAAKSKQKGQKSIKEKKWPTVVSHAKFGRAQETSGRKKVALHDKKQNLQDQLSNLQLPDEITPKFFLNSKMASDQIVVSIHQGLIAYKENPPLLTDIHLSFSSKDRLAISGDNGSGKSTLIKAILNDNSITRTGQWLTPKPSEIGYLDQHYQTLDREKSVYENLSEVVPTWSMVENRRHLNDFLFRKNDEVYEKVASLSGGERARLSLALIAAKVPQLLILDEMTNNLDLDTRTYIIQILKVYPGALLVISHDTNFLKEIGIENIYYINQNALTKI